MTQPGHLFRAAAYAAPANPELGLLSNLPGVWIGNGFNLIARPARQGGPQKQAFFLELNGTRETLEFAAIGGDIPDRGDIEPTIMLHAVHYMQTVADCADNSFIHKEPGLWLHVPPTHENPSETYVRQSVIPHGDSLLAQSTSFYVLPGGPDIQPVNAMPFAESLPILPLNDVTPRPNPGQLGYTDPYLNPKLPAACLPPGLAPAQTVADPTNVLRAQIQGQQFAGTEVIQISTVPDGGIVNIPFVTANSNAVLMDAIFWIERVLRSADGGDETEFLQLQYVQRVILDFDEIHWPHVSVATLVKTA